jgi:hypothetical protein
LRADAAASTASRPASVTIASRPSGGETAGDIEVIWVWQEQKYFSKQGWTGFTDLPDRQFGSEGLRPSSVIYFHPQSPAIDFIAAKTRLAVASRNGACTGINQIITSGSRSIALSEAFLKV